MIPPDEYEEAIQRGCEELRVMSRWGADYALEAMLAVMRAYDDDEEATE